MTTNDISKVPEHLFPLIDEFENELRRGRFPNPIEFICENDDNYRCAAALMQTLSSTYRSHPNCKEWASAPPIPGYEILTQLGCGGAGRVFLAKDKHTSKMVAIKTLRRQSGIAVRDQIQKEAETGLTLQHPNIVSVLDFDVFDGIPFLVMEFVNGLTLADSQVDDMTGVETAKVMVKLAGAIQYAHENNILHCDLKPSNVMVGENNDVKIIDFGLRREIDSTFHSSGLIGTVQYMAPEQIRAKTLSVQTDVFGLGSILYFILTGRPVRTVDSPYSPCNLYSAAINPPVLPSSKCHFKRELSRICAICLAQNPADRCSSALELQFELESLILSEPRTQNTNRESHARNN